MKTIIHKSESRGNANHGWLNANHSFSFASWYNPERMNFGALRVLNDDVVSAKMGFGTHPHDNMEIITIPLEGGIEHKDSMGNSGIVNAGEVQVMSAGTGIQHSEVNKNKDLAVKLLQIWVIPNKRNVEPRYQQIEIKSLEEKNKFFQILSPNSDDQGVWIHQDAYFSMGNFDKGTSDTYKLNIKNNGIYLFVIDGSVSIEGSILNKRDAMGITNADQIELLSESNSKVLLMEVPMTF